MPEIFVIIVTYKGKLWYDRCFESLRQSEIPVKTVVIDNASNDGTVEYIRENFPEVHIIPSEKNLGFGQGNNLGIKYALANGADYVFLLNQDAWLIEPNVFTELITVAHANPDYAILSPLQLYASAQNIANGIQQHFVDGQTAASDFVSDLFFKRPLKKIYDVPYVCAASWFIPRTIIEKIGGFDPIFFHYGEDDNYLQRIEYHGYKVGVCPQLNVCHDVEFRDKTYGSVHQDWKKNLLLSLTDITKQVDLSKERDKYLKKAIFQCLMLNFKRAKFNFEFYKFIKYNSRQIEKSRYINTNETSCWL